MEKKKCKQCGKLFESKRVDSLYCSNPCKQKAHHKRSTEKSEKLSKSITGKELNVFYLDEYEEVNKEGFGFDIILYCFLRRNLGEKSTVDEIKKFFNSYWDDSLDNGYNYLKESNSFKIFRERFLDGEFTILATKS